MVEEKKRGQVFALLALCVEAPRPLFYAVSAPPVPRANPQTVPYVHWRTRTAVSRRACGCSPRRMCGQRRARAATVAFFPSHLRAEQGHVVAQHVGCRRGGGGCVGGHFLEGDWTMFFGKRSEVCCGTLTKKKKIHRLMLSHLHAVASISEQALAPHFFILPKKNSSLDEKKNFFTHSLAPFFFPARRDRAHVPAKQRFDALKHGVRVGRVGSPG